MMQASLKAITVAALIGVGMLSLPSSAKAGWGCGGWGCGWGPALVGLGVGTVIGSALFAPRVYAARRPSMLTMDRQPGRPNGTPIAPSATAASIRIPVISPDMTASPISASSRQAG